MSSDPISQQAVGQIGQQPVAQFAKQAVSQIPARLKTMTIGTHLHRMNPIFGRLVRVQDDPAEAGGTGV